LIFSFGLFTALNHAIGPQGKFGNLKYYIVEPLKKKVINFFKEKCGKQNKKEGNQEPQNRA